MLQNIKNTFFGLAIGDALGVPVEFQSREIITQNPVTGMREFGTHNQPKGTWSDDSSMAFCLAESISKIPQNNLIQDVASNFVKWKYENYWTPHGKVFDIGIATTAAIKKIKEGGNPLLTGGATEYSNGNGSLMRILPLVFYKKYLNEGSTNKRFGLVSKVSSITHTHFRSCFACFIYTEFAKLILEQGRNKDKVLAYQALQKLISDFATEFDFDKDEVAYFDRILKKDIRDFSEQSIKSSGYVLHTLEASFWCFLTTNSYSKAILKAVNLGEDTDTTGCVVGGIAGLYYGQIPQKGIPKNWQEVIVQKENIGTLAQTVFQANFE